MKIAAVSFALITFISTPACTAAPVLVVSPDRPPDWYNRAGDKVGEELDWNAERHQVEARVAYNRLDYDSERDQTYYDRFQLAFPNIRLDDATGRLFVVNHAGRREGIGYLKDGALGRRVVLDENLRFSVFRANGVVNAVIASKPTTFGQRSRD